MSNKLILQLLAVVALTGIEMNMQAGVLTPRGPGTATTTPFGVAAPVYLLDNGSSRFTIREVISGNVLRGGAIGTSKYILPSSFYSQIKEGYSAYTLEVNKSYLLFPENNGKNGLYIQIVSTDKNHVVLAWEYSHQANQIVSNASVVQTDSSGFCYLHGDSSNEYSLSSNQ